MLKKTLVSIAALLPTLAFAHSGQWCAPEIDGSATVLGLAILGGVLAFMKKKA